MPEPQQIPEAWTVRRVLEWTAGHLGRHGSETPRLDAEVLLAQARGCKRIELYTRYDEVLTEEQRAVMRDLVRRRAAAEPVAYLVGHREFFGLDFHVTPDVLIPRPDTEALVVEALETCRRHEAPRLLDVGTGSGCIAVAVAVNCPSALVTAVDVSEAALHVACENAELHGVADRIRFLHGDLFEPLADEDCFEIIVSNPPYIREDEFAAVQDDVRLHEPRSALLGGRNGLAVTRRLIEQAPARLVPGGRLLVEIAPEQSDEVLALMAALGSFAEIAVLKDLSGSKRIATALRRE